MADRCRRARRHRPVGCRERIVAECVVHACRTKSERLPVGHRPDGAVAAVPDGSRDNRAGVPRARMRRAWRNTDRDRRKHPEQHHAPPPRTRFARKVRRLLHGSQVGPLVRLGRRGPERRLQAKAASGGAAAPRAGYAIPHGPSLRHASASRTQPDAEASASACEDQAGPDRRDGKGLVRKASDLMPERLCFARFASYDADRREPDA